MPTQLLADQSFNYFCMHDNNYNYDPAWENRAYAHIKFGHFFGPWNSNSVPKHTVSVVKLLHLVENTMGTSMKFTELSIPYTEGEISGIM